MIKTLSQYPGATQYVLTRTPPRAQIRRARTVAIVRLAVPLLFILTVGLVTGCLVAIMETSFGP